MKTIMGFTISALFFLSPAIAATYWISSNGAAANLAACSGSTPMSGTSACSMDKANGSEIVAGDTVYYRAGTYTGITATAMRPYNTGTSSKITLFSSYNGESVEFVGSGVKSFALDLDSEYGIVRSYIKVQGFKFTNFMKHLWIRKGTHLEISNCSFLGYPDEATKANFEGIFQATYIYRQAQYNWIHDCIFGKWGYNAEFGYDTGGVFGMGLESSTTDYTMYNLVENNEMYAGGHHVAYLNGSYNVYRNNYFHNEPWYPLDVPVYSTRIIAQEGYPGDGMRNLNEGNRIGYGGPKNKNEIGGSGGQVKGAYNIWRYNTYMQTYTNAIYMTKYVGQSDVKYNKIYNNTFWKGGYGTYQATGGIKPSSNWEDRYTHPLVVEEGASGSTVYGNTIKNNLFFDNKDALGKQYSIISRYYSTRWVTQVPLFQDISKNWLDNSGDPLFVDTTGTPDPKNKSQWNLNLQVSSPAIDSGTYLTTAVGAGSNSFTITVLDAGYFFFPWSNMAANIPAANLSADWIAIGTIGNVAKISLIDYLNNKIALENAMTWSDGARVWLYKKSDGMQVLSGSAPDMGAFEYRSDGALSAPGNVRIVP